MGDCVYCGKNAGFMRKAHSECKNVYERGRQEILTVMANAVSSGGDQNQLMKHVSKTASSSYIRGGDLRDVMAAGFEAAVDKALDDHLLSYEEEAYLSELKGRLGVSEQVLDKNRAVTRLVQSGVLREITEGKIPQRQVIAGPLPFNLQKSESLVWVFEGVVYLEEKTRTQYRGGSRGVSVRVMKGVYYRVGSFKGRRVETSETVRVDRGLMGLTTKHIYFAGPKKRFRIRYDRIVSFDPYADGIGVMREAQSAKPQTFVTGDGWFTYNLVMNLAQV